MSEYSSVANLSKRIKPQALAELADDTNTPASISDTTTVAVITQAIQDASAEIDSHLHGHIDMSDATNAALVEKHCAFIALYYLYQRRYQHHSDNPMAAAYDDSMRWLKDVARGKIHIKGTPQTPDGDFYAVKDSDDDLTFSDDELSRF